MFQHAFKYLEDHRSNGTTEKRAETFENVARQIAENKVDKRTEKERKKAEIEGKILEDYFTTFRAPSFKHDHWKMELNKTQLEDIENFPDCQSAIEMLGYD